MRLDGRHCVSLGPLMRAGEVWLAGVARWQVGACVSGGFVIAEGAKTPVAVLVDGPGGRQALAPDGRTLTPAALEAVMPGAWAAFDAAMQQQKISPPPG